MNNANKIIMTSILAAAVLIPILTDQAFAKHQGANVHLEFEKHTWSRSASDSHKSLLNCGTGSNSDKCAVKVMVYDAVKKSGVSKSDVSTIVDKLRNYF